MEEIMALVGVFFDPGAAVRTLRRKGKSFVTAHP